MRIYAPQNRAARARRTRTGRVVATVGLLIGAAVVAPQALATSEPGEPEAVDSYTIAAGETLWEVAAALTPTGEDARDTLAQISRLNALEDSLVRVGDQILVPVVD